MKEPALPERRLATDALRALYPAVVGSGVGPDGVFIGLDSRSARFHYDAWELHRRRVCPTPHKLVLGQLRRGKSALVKTYLFRQTAFGRWSFVLDPKGEYASFAEAVGGRVIRLVPGGHLRIDPFAGRDVRAQEEMLLAVARAVLGRDPDPLERKALRVALEAAGPEPRLPAIVEALLWPDPEVAKTLGHGVTTDLLAEAGRAAGFQLQQLVGRGRLAGMFDGPTTPGLDRLSDVTVLDLSEVWWNHQDALDVVMLLADGWFRSLVDQQGDRRGIYVVDEGWALLRSQRVAEDLQAGFKLVSQDGVQRIMIMHGFSDLDATGDVGAKVRELARGLVRDSGVWVVYNQNPAEAKITAEVLQLNSIELDVITSLDVGVGLWKVGDRDGVVISHRRAALEEAFTNTDSMMLDAGAVR